MRMRMRMRMRRKIILTTITHKDVTDELGAREESREGGWRMTKVFLIRRARSGKSKSNTDSPDIKFTLRNRRSRAVT
jgi:hypothetical protein